MGPELSRDQVLISGITSGRADNSGASLACSGGLCAGLEVKAALQIAGLCEVALDGVLDRPGAGVCGAGRCSNRRC